MKNDNNQIFVKIINTEPSGRAEYAYADRALNGKVRFIFIKNIYEISDSFIAESSKNLLDDIIDYLKKEEGYDELYLDNWKDYIFVADSIEGFDEARDVYEGVINYLRPDKPHYYVPYDIPVNPTVGDIVSASEYYARAIIELYLIDNELHPWFIAPWDMAMEVYKRISGKELSNNLETCALEVNHDYFNNVL